MTVIFSEKPNWRYGATEQGIQCWPLALTHMHTQIYSNIYLTNTHRNNNKLKIICSYPLETLFVESVFILLTLDMYIKSKYSFFLGNKTSFTVGTLSDIKKKITSTWLEIKTFEENTLMLLNDKRTYSRDPLSVHVHHHFLWIACVWAKNEAFRQKRKKNTPQIIVKTRFHGL